MTVVITQYCANCGRQCIVENGPCPQCGEKLYPRLALSCPSCNDTVYAGDNYCTWCGVDLHAASQKRPGYCHRCGTRLSGEFRYCTKCGERVEQTRGAVGDASDFNDDPAITLYGMPRMRGPAPVYASPDIMSGRKPKWWKR